MADNLLLHLSTDWALGCDKNQWMVLRRQKRREETYWNPIRFVGTTKTTLRRILREIGIRIDPEAESIINGWPERFLDWVREHQAEVDRAPVVPDRKAA